MELTQGSRETSPVPAELSTMADVTSAPAGPKSSLLRSLSRSVWARVAAAVLTAMGIAKTASAQSLQSIQSSPEVVGTDFCPYVYL